jgi:hypothetical protein
MNITLIRTICCKLDVDGSDAALSATRRAFNAAATWVAWVCWEEGITNTNTAHHRVYGETRPTFGPRGSIRYDACPYRLMSLDRVSLNTMDGRVVCRLLLGAR